MRAFFLLRTGEIVEGESPPLAAVQDWDSIPTKMNGVSVLALASNREAVEQVKVAIFGKEEVSVGLEHEAVPCPA